MNKYDVIIVGGGAAGMMAASRASTRHKRVLLIERNKRLGTKILITGKGRCNITNDCDIEELLNQTCRNKHFMYSAYYTFSNTSIMEYFKNRGLVLKTERGKRVFPQSDRAADVRNVMRDDLQKNGVIIQYNTMVKSLLITDNQIIGVITESGQELIGTKVVLACGGQSYKLTGSDGYGYVLAKQAGHKIIEPKASLTGVYTKESWTEKAMGVTMKNVKVTATYRNKKLYEEIGEMLFTHFGLSGPLILTASRYFLDTGYDQAKIILDVKPGLSEEKLYKRICRDFDENPKKQYDNALRKLVPANMVIPMIMLTGINGDKQVNQISKEERKKLVDTLKNMTFSITGGRGFKEAIITAGGVSTKEINPSTMESKKVKGLYFAGEMIDVDAFTGGFNLTIAFSTGYLAGEQV